tara:strand:- start:593 stop:721 length:129 start_codon:yes stop_codon:yes gene_type:complete
VASNGKKIREVDTTRHTREMFTWVMLLDVIAFLPRMFFGLFK